MESTRKKIFSQRNRRKISHVDCLLVWFLPVDLSGLVVPARGSHASAGWVLRIIETHEPLHHGKVAVHRRGCEGGVVIFSLGVLRQCWFAIWNIYMFIISYFLDEIPSLIRFPSRSMISFKHSPLDDDTDSLIVVCWFSLMNSWNAFC